MCNEYNTQNGFFCQNIPVPPVQDLEDEVYVRESQAELSLIRQQLLDIYFDDCECTEECICDRCDFIQRLQNCAGIIDFDLTNRAIERGDPLLQDILSVQSSDVIEDEEDEVVEEYEDSIFNREVYSDGMFNPDMYSVQSGTTQQVTVAFGDNNTGDVAGFKTPVDYVNTDESWATGINDFMKRPVLISTYTWTVGAALNQSIEPWHAYFNSTPIKKKLDNYYLVRCNLKVKVVINASPFYYGCVLMSYRPLTDLSSSGFNPSPVYSGTGSGNIVFMGRSQRPHAYVYPQTNEGCTLELPFMYYKNWLNATSAADLRSMGCINFDSFGVLLNANAVAGTTVNIQVYAWAEDVKLAGATDDLAVQAGDEYQADGAVSSVASAIERTTKRLTDIPVIGPFMTATSFAAGAVKNIARIFGYTNVPVIDDVHAMINKPFPNLATTDIGIPVEKLTLDSKNELTIDPAICGCKCEDPLVISRICGIESYIFTTTWAASNNVNDLLFNSRVEPTLNNYSTVSTQNYVQGIPGWMVAQMFKHWRGDIIFRFKFLKSQYHRGRVKITWDPVADIQAVAETTTTAFTHIVDIADTDDIELRIPYLQPTSYLMCGRDVAVNQFDVTAITSSPTTSNGVLTVRVLTEQSSPVSSADINILVFARCAENIEFADPQRISDTYFGYIVQSGDAKETVSIEDMAIAPSNADDNLNLIYMGETVTSLRQLMRRPVLHRVFQPIANSTTNNLLNILTSRFRRYPLYPGFDVNGIHSANKTLTAGTAPFNFVNWVPMTWVTQCFVGSRGSIIYNMNNNATGCQSNVVSRSNTIDLTVPGYSTATNILSTSYSASSISRAAIVNSNPGMAGHAVTNNATNTSMNVLAPMYSMYKMVSNDYATRTLGSAVDGTTKDALSHVFTTFGFSNQFNKVEIYASIGTDFNPIMFLNVPTLYHSVTYPTAVV